MSRRRATRALSLLALSALMGAASSPCPAASAQPPAPAGKWLTATVESAEGASHPGVVLMVEFQPGAPPRREVTVNALVLGEDGTERVVPLPPTDDRRFAALIDIPGSFDPHRLRVLAEGRLSDGTPFQRIALPVRGEEVAPGESSTSVRPTDPSDRLGPSSSIDSNSPGSEGEMAGSQQTAQSLWPLGAVGALALLSAVGGAALWWRTVRAEAARPAPATTLDDEIEIIATRVESEMFIDRSEDGGTAPVPAEVKPTPDSEQTKGEGGALETPDGILEGLRGEIGGESDADDEPNREMASLRRAGGGPGESKPT